MIFATTSIFIATHCGSISGAAPRAGANRKSAHSWDGLYSGNEVVITDHHIPPQRLSTQVSAFGRESQALCGAVGGAVVGFLFSERSISPWKFHIQLRQ